MQRIFFFCSPFLIWRFPSTQYYRFRCFPFDKCMKLFDFLCLYIIFSLFKHNFSTSYSENKLACHKHLDCSTVHSTLVCVWTAEQSNIYPPWEREVLLFTFICRYGDDISIDNSPMYNLLRLPYPIKYILNRLLVLLVSSQCLVLLHTCNI